MTDPTNIDEIWISSWNFILKFMWIETLWISQECCVANFPTTHLGSSDINDVWNERRYLKIHSRDTIPRVKVRVSFTFGAEYRSIPRLRNSSAFLAPEKFSSCGCARSSIAPSAWRIRQLLLIKLSLCTQLLSHLASSIRFTADVDASSLEPFFTLTCLDYRTWCIITGCVVDRPREHFVWHSPLGWRRYR